MGCRPWGREELDTTERLHFDFSLSCIGEGNGNPLQCSCLETPREGAAWWAAAAAMFTCNRNLTFITHLNGFSLVAQTVKNLPTIQETWVRSLEGEDTLEKGMATHSSILAWRIPWAEMLDWLQSIELQRVSHN